MDLIERGLKIDERIYSVRGRQVILDRDLALLYQVEVAQMHTRTTTARCNHHLVSIFVYIG